MTLQTGLNELDPYERNKLLLKIRVERERRRRAKQSSVQYDSYQSDPVAFCREVLNVRVLTDDLILVLESVRDNQTTVVESANGIGKTFLAAHIATWFYKVFSGAQIYTTAAPPLDNLKKLLWGEIGKVKRANPNIFKNDRDKELVISRPINSVDPSEFITGVTIPSVGSPEEREARFSGKHAPYLLFIIDEGDAVPEEVYRGIESCMSGGVARLLVMYNPRSDGGPVSKLKKEGAHTIIADAFSHPNVVTGQDIIPGAVTREKTLNRVHAWTRPYEEAVALNFTGYGSYDVPEHLVGVSCLHEKTKEPLPPLSPGRRMVIDSRFSYMVLARYPGTSIGMIYDTWVDVWDSVEGDLKHLAENGTWEQCRGVEWPRVPGNVSAEYDYEPGEGSVYWSLDEGYEGKVDSDGNFTADSHPRAIGLYQFKPNGDMVLFDECYMILEPNYENQIQVVLDRGYERPEFVVLGPGSKSLGGWLSQQGFYKKTWAGRVEDSIKEARSWISGDENGHRRFKVHPRCKHTRYEYPRYKRDENGRIVKAFDHGVDRDRYLLWMFRNVE